MITFVYMHNIINPLDMIKKILAVFMFAGIISCNMEQRGKVLYEGNTFVVYSDKVVQDTFKAEAKSPKSIVSNYQSPANKTFSKLLEFKFSINGKDNELPFGVNHTILVEPGPDKKMESRIIPFGKKDTVDRSAPPNDYLKPNVALTVKADLRHVFEAFEDQEFYEFHDGSRIYQEDFKGVWIAGGSAPLSWDFDNLPSRDHLQMKDPDGDHIYTISLTLNPFTAKEELKEEWTLSRDISAYPSYNPGMMLPEALYNMSLEELRMLITEDNTFDTGAKWPGVWTRDVSYSVLLSLAIIEPEIAKNSLLKKVQNGHIIQDTGTGGAYPVSTDRVTWALAAWEVYKATGDREWLSKAFHIIRNSVEADLTNAWNDEIHLFRGESSFLDWRGQSYPRWMEPVHIYESYNLGTNAVFYRALNILVEMGSLLNENTGKYEEIAQQVKAGINELLWIERKGYFGQYLYGKNYPVLSDRSEALGGHLAVLFDVVKNKERAKKFVAYHPVVEYGVPTIYPQIPEIPPYHNNGIWPFVQAYRTWAAAKVKNPVAVEKSIASIYRQAAFFLTNKENFVAENGDYKGTQVNSDRQLWSVAGNLALVYRIFFGMEYRPDKLVFQPFIPEVYDGVKELNHLKYRNAKLKIRIEGYGDKIENFIVDGKAQEEPSIAGDLEGDHQITIFMNNSFENEGQMNKVDNHFTATYPKTVRLNDKLVWKPVKGAEKYRVYRNGKLLNTTVNTFSAIDDTVNYSEYQVSSVDKKGWESFLSNPLKVVNEKHVQYIELEDRMPKSDRDYKGYTGDGFVKMDTSTTVRFTVNIPESEEGKYLLDFRYANGHGPVNTNNKCAVRTLYVNQESGRAMVFPQRGDDEWSNWGYSNSHIVYLEAGANQIKLMYKPENENMNVEVNEAMLDKARLIKGAPKLFY